MRALKKFALAVMLVFALNSVVYAADEIEETQEVQETQNNDVVQKEQGDLSVNEVKEETRQLNVTANKDNSYTIILTDANLPENIQNVQFPVWSEKNGQDDLKWYTAEKKDDSTYTYTFKLTDHKGLGKYNVHAYGVDKSGKRTFLTETEFNIANPAVSSIDIERDSSDAGKFKVVISGLNDTTIKNVVVPIWSEKNGQDDLKWYTAQKNDEGNYYVDVDVKNHKYTMGMYDIHVYVDDVTGVRSFVSKTTSKIDMTYSNLTATTSDGSKYTIKLDGLNAVEGIKNVRFPVWSSVNGQDDLKWYVAKRQEDGSWQCEVRLSDHKGLGTYNLHAYVAMPDGSNQFIGETTFETKRPIIGKISAELIDKENGKIQVRLTGIENSELITKVQVPIWSDKKQSDIIWYTAEKQSDGTYVVNTDISHHENNCKLYNVHAYITDVTGMRSYACETTIDLSPKCESLTATDLDGKENDYTITLKNLQVTGGAKNVQFAVWGEDKGQNDLKWYTASKNSDGSYSYTFKINNHKEFGQYQIHAYCTTKNGKREFITSTTCSVVTRATAADVEVSEIDGTKGTFKVTVSGVMAPSGIDTVQIPMWCSSNQNDLKWYTAMKVSEGVYTATMNVLNHKYYFGTYKIHVYATMGNGVRTFVTSRTADIQPKNYVYSLAKTSTTREVGVLGATGNRVQFPTWSNSNGQDDIVWYEGTNCGNGKWNAIVNSNNHKHAGEYTTHVYITNNGKSNFAGAMNYSLQKIPQGLYEMSIRANMYSSSTGYLALVNRSTHKVAIFQGSKGSWNCVKYWDCADGKASTPTVTGVFRVGSRGYYFDSGSARCYWWTQFYGNYLFHSVLYTHSGQLMDGRVGIALSHGCVRLKIENAKWIYDNIPSRTTVVVY